MRLLWLCLGLVACGPTPEAAERFFVESFRPPADQSIRLNEPLALVFSEAPDPLSLTPASLSVLDAQGQAVRGEWTVEGRWARFWPALPKGAELEDGGYQPGEAHRVKVLGFPGIGGIRTRSGRFLDRTYRFPFRVQGLEESEAFLDFSPFGCAPVTLEVLPGQGAGIVREGDPLRLFCGEPLDPRSLHSEDFRIVRLPYAPGPGQPAQELYSEVRAILVRNAHEDRVSANQAAAEIQLLPQTPLVLDSRAEYALEVRADVRLADFSGHSPWPQAVSPSARELYRFRLQPLGAHDRNRVRLDFLDRSRLTSERIPWASGEVAWEVGRLTLWCPRSAGEGGDGDLIWPAPAELIGPQDLHATSAHITSGGSLVGNSDGPWILRSQTRWELAGRLERTGETSTALTPGEWYAAHRGASVQDLIEAAQAQSLPWTVLVAAGDLLLEGEVRSDTPLVLVAAGRVRITGSVFVPPGELYVVGDGGGSVPGQSVQYLPLEFSTPGRNPLQTTLRGALITSVLPSWVLDRYEWESLVVLDDPGRGQVQVSFLPADGPILRERLVNHPRLLPPDSPVRILVELSMPPGGLWDPPVVDRIELSWRGR